MALWMMLVCFALVFLLVRLARQKNLKLFFAALLLFAVCDVYWQYLNVNSYYVGTNLPNSLLDNCPLWLAVTANFILSVLAFTFLIRVIRLQRRRISAVSIKESFDSLPSGVCFYETGGRIYLINEAMEEITKRLFSRHIYNGEMLWNGFSEKDVGGFGENEVVVNVDGKIFSISRFENDVNGQTIFELIASDISEEAEQNRLLEEKKAELEDLNRRLEEYDKNLAKIVRERELIRSKAKIHDEMNILIVSTLKSIDAYSAEEAERLAERWKSNVLELERDTEAYRRNPAEALDELAEALGIRLEMTGELPENAADIRLLITAVSECMVNALRHAGSESIFVKSEKGGALITNDGKPPDCEIIEGGGLTNLRNRAKAAGAELEIESIPEFSLRIKYKEENV